MSAKEQAIKDIKSDLREQHKSFLAFHKELNPIMNEIVRNQLNLQQRLK